MTNDSTDGPAEAPAPPSDEAVKAAMIKSLAAAFPGMDVKVINARQNPKPDCHCFSGPMAAAIDQVVDTRIFAMEKDVYERLMRLEGTPAFVDGTEGALLWEPCDVAFPYMAGMLLAALFMRAYKIKYDATPPEKREGRVFLPLALDVHRKGEVFAQEAAVHCITRLTELSVMATEANDAVHG